MSKKKKTRSEVYAEVVAGYGYKMEECKVIHAVFEKPSGPESFHYAVMFAKPKIPYILFDCEDLDARVIIKSDHAVEAQILGIIERLGGRPPQV